MTGKFSIGDAAELAGDVGPDQRLIGVLMEVSGRIDLARLRRRVDAALVELPVLERRIVRRGRNTLAARWVPAPAPAAEHVTLVRVATAPLRAVEEIMHAGLPQDRPMWHVTLLDDGVDTHLLFVAHHALVDGATAVALVGTLLGTGPGGHHLPESPAGRRVRLPLGLLAGVTGPASATSLLTPIRPGFRLATVSVRLDAVQEAGRRAGATVNDVVLAAVASSIRRLAASRGESLGRVVISVPVTGQPSPGARLTRNAVAAFAVSVPDRSPGQNGNRQLARLARRTARRKALVRAFPGTSGFSLLLATLGRLGLYRPMFERQRAITTLVTNLRGPEREMTLDGARIVSLTPVSPALGNVCLVFAAVSYAGQLRISVRMDRSVWRDQELLVTALTTAFEQLVTESGQHR